MDVSGSILAHLMDAGHPCRHDEVLPFSFSVGEHKIMNHFVVMSIFLFGCGSAALGASE
jgi:hypothetical protein